MSILDYIFKSVRKEDQTKFTIKPDSEGLNFVLSPKELSLCRSGELDNWAHHQYVYLRQLEEQGWAESIGNGFSVPAAVIAALENEDGYLLGLPDRFSGSFEAQIAGSTPRSDFDVQLVPVLADGSKGFGYKIKGPYLILSEQEVFRLRPEELKAFESLSNHQDEKPVHGIEHHNLLLVAGLQNAKNAGMNINLSHFDRLGVVLPDAVRVAVSECSDGSLTLTPAYGGSVNQSLVDSRVGQVSNEGEQGTLRVGDKIVVLDEARLKATQEILSNRTIPKAQVKEFFKHPSAFLDSALVNLDVGFSVRVKGAEKFHFVPFGETDKSGVDWFTLNSGILKPSQLSQVIQDEEALNEFENLVIEAQASGAELVTYDGVTVDISNSPELDEQFKKLRERLHENKIEDDFESSVEERKMKPEQAVVSTEEVQVNVASLLQSADKSHYIEKIDFSMCSRSPYPHQEEGIRWAFGLALESTKRNYDDVNRISGALLADDMGLGKTYMGLVTFAQYYKHLQNQKLTKKPILVVAPLSLLENWESEIRETFSISPFKDIVVLQSGRDLSKYKLKGARRETQQAFEEGNVLNQDAIQYSLKVGKGYVDRLDIGQRLVLTTYQTLRDYQFSLCLIDWGIVLFDEAQNIKNPNTLAARGAKGLKADFKLLATGTPVENSLADYWAIMDVAQPRLLGSRDEFRDTYIKPIRDADDELKSNVRIDIGRKLRSDVGAFMLRRLKEDELLGLPEKRLFTGTPELSSHRAKFADYLASTMKGGQLANYDGVLDSYLADKSNGDVRGKALSTLHGLKTISIHPGLSSSEMLFCKNEKEAHGYISESGKLKSVCLILGQIKSRDEKVIIFAITKKLQRYLKIWLEKIYKIDISIINGETKAVSTNGGGLTRKALVDQFESTLGFGVIIMSPIAAGTGLTVVGANNVIHLERHWNPAKEAQATDRVYRIGQEKPVNIYYPISLHPNRTSFDVNLDQLLSTKVSLSDAVVTPVEVSEGDFSVLR